MRLYLLNAGGAGLWVIAIFLITIFTVLVIFIEAGIMTAFKYNHFKKSLGDSAFANIASTVVGFILILFYSDLFRLVDWKGYISFFVATIIVESSALYLLNSEKSFLKTILVCLAMNMISYPVLYLFSRMG